MVKFTGTSWPVTLVFLVPMYSVGKQNDFAIKMLPANCLVSFSVASNLSDNAFDSLASIFGSTYKLFSAYCDVCLLSSIIFRVFTLVVSREIVFMFTTSRDSGIVKNPLSLIYYSYLKLCIIVVVFFVLSSVHAVLLGGSVCFTCTGGVWGTPPRWPELHKTTKRFVPKSQRFVKRTNQKTTIKIKTKKERNTYKTKSDYSKLKENKKITKLK